MAVASLAAVGRFKRVTGGEHLTWLAIAGYVATALLVVGVFVAHRRRERRAAKLAQLDSGGVKSERRES
jgi:LPXTG-motif cell wall-anchored protein